MFRMCLMWLRVISLPARWRKIVTSPNVCASISLSWSTKKIEFQKNTKTFLSLPKWTLWRMRKLSISLYEASNAGWKSGCCARICCLIPGWRLKREYRGQEYCGQILRTLAYLRFNNNSSQRVFLSSADWMSRNFDRRIELLFEVSRQDLNEQVRFILDKYWGDNAKTHISPQVVNISALFRKVSV